MIKLPKLAALGTQNEMEYELLTESYNLASIELFRKYVLKSLTNSGRRWNYTRIESLRRKS